MSLTLGRVCNNQDGMAIVDLKTSCTKDNLLVIVKYVLQVFFVKDNAHDGKHVVLQRKRKIIGIEGVIDKEVYNGYEEMAPFEVDIDLTIFKGSEKTKTSYMRLDSNEALIVN